MSTRLKIAVSSPSDDDDATSTSHHPDDGLDDSNSGNTDETAADDNNPAGNGDGDGDENDESKDVAGSTEADVMEKSSVAYTVKTKKKKEGVVDSILKFFGFRKNIKPRLREIIVRNGDKDGEKLHLNVLWPCECIILKKKLQAFVGIRSDNQRLVSVVLTPILSRSFIRRTPPTNPGKGLTTNTKLLFLFSPSPFPFLPLPPPIPLSPRSTAAAS